MSPLLHLNRIEEESCPCFFTASVLVNILLKQDPFGLCFISLSEPLCRCFSVFTLGLLYVLFLWFLKQLEEAKSTQVSRKRGCFGFAILLLSVEIIQTVMVIPLYLCIST